MSRPRIAVLFGGTSAEHDVSVRSAVQVAASIDVGRYEPCYVGITRAGAWRQCDAPGPGWEATSCRPAVLAPDRQLGGLLVGDGDRWSVVPIDVVLPVLHGTGGEDGAIQGLLELSGIPYVGCDIPSSVRCFDKSLAYLVAAAAGIETPTWWVLDDASARLPADLPLPVFVKPARCGSSFGVTRVDAPDDLDAAITAARRHDRKVLVEAQVVGTEVGCAVLGDGRDLVVGAIDQITLSHGIFRIHQEATPEQGSENAVITVPAELPDATRDRIRTTATAVYTALGCRGLARVDLFLCPDGRLVLNEVNTLPGLTSYSRYPRMMAAAGLDLTAVLDRCLALATER